MKMPRFALVAPLGGLMLLAGLAGCGNDSGFAEVGSAQIAIEPEEVVFGQVAAGDSQSQVVEISNPGSETLVITGWDWEGSHADFEVAGLVPMEIEPGDSTYVTVTYTPLDPEVDDADIVITANASNDRDPRIHVSSSGQSGILIATPDPVILIGETINTTVTADVTFYNGGSEPVHIGDGFITSSSGELVLTDQPEFPIDLSPEQSMVMTVSYTPTQAGSDEGTLLISCDAPNCDGNRYQVPIQASLTTPFLVVSPPAVGFDPTAIGDTSTAGVILRNQGEAPLEISNIDFAMNPERGDQEIFITAIGETPYDATDSSFTLEAEEFVEVTLSYSPLDATADREAMVIRSNDPEIPITQVQVAGAPAVPALEVFPSELSFPLVAVGYTSTLNVTIRNGGTETLELGDITQRGDEVFTMLNIDEYPATLEPAEQFDLEIEFAPDLALVTYGGSLIVTALNDPNTAEAFVVLSANSDTEPVCNIRPEPPTVGFGTVPRGVRREDTLIFRNTGSGPCTVSRIQLDPPSLLSPQYFELVSATPSRFPIDLMPGETIETTVAYFPRELSILGDLLGDNGSISLTVTDTTSGDPVACGVSPPLGSTRLCGANLNGRSAIASIGTVPSQIDFGLVTLGCNSQTMEIRIYNTGGADVELTDIYLEDCTTEFDLAGVPTMPYLMSPGAATAIQVRYRPNTEEADACRVVIESGSETSRLIVPLRGEGTTSSHQVDVFEQVSGRDVDVLFVVDNSGSMGDEQENLRASFGDFISSAELWDTNFQIGVVTTQIDGDVSDPTGGSRQPGELLGREDTRIITPRTPNFQGVFEEVIIVGTDSPGAQEAGLQAAQLALSDPVITDLGVACDADCTEPYGCYPGANAGAEMCGGYNRTFLRETASLEIIFVSDEEDQSSGTLAFYEDFFRNIKGFRNDALFHASAIVGPRGGCGEDAEEGERYMEIADATHGASGSVCASNFSSSLTEIGNRAFGLRVQFFLSRVPDPTSIRVSMEGSAVTSGWTYDSESNAIIWDDAAAPQPGDEFEVEYDALCF